MVCQENHRNPTQAALMPLQGLPLLHLLDNIIKKVAQGTPQTTHRGASRPRTECDQKGERKKIPLKLIEEANTRLQFRGRQAYKFISIKPRAVLRSMPLRIRVKVVFLDPNHRKMVAL